MLDSNERRDISTKGVELIKTFEAFKPDAYIPVKGDVPTIGYGFTKGVKMGDTITLEEATRRLAVELRPYVKAVNDSCTKYPTQNQFDAMVSLAYNIGVAGFKGSSVVRYHNAGDTNATLRSFMLWNKCKGNIINGLVRRRNKEALLYAS